MQKMGISAPVSDTLSVVFDEITASNKSAPLQSLQERELRVAQKLPTGNSAQAIQTNIEQTLATKKLVLPTHGVVVHNSSYVQGPQTQICRYNL